MMSKILRLYSDHNSCKKLYHGYTSIIQNLMCKCNGSIGKDFEKVFTQFTPLRYININTISKFDKNMYHIQFNHLVCLSKIKSHHNHKEYFKIRKSFDPFYVIAYLSILLLSGCSYNYCFQRSKSSNIFKALSWKRSYCNSNDHLFKNQKLKINSTESVTLGKVSDFNPNKINKIHLKDREKTVILCFDGHQWHCLSSKCPHAGADLSNAVFSENQVFCQLHNASFDIKTGNSKFGPNFRSLQKYPTNVIDGFIVSEIPLKDSTQDCEMNRLPILQKVDDSKVYVIMGGGASAAAASYSMRKNGFDGRIIILSNEPYVPYDKTYLSKQIDKSINEILWFDAEFYQKNKIELRNNVTVKELCTEKNYIVLANGEILPYNKVLIAVGSSPIKLNVEGSNLNNIYTVRGFDDIMKIKEFAHRKSKITIIGSSFIAMEMCSVLRDKGAEVTIVTAEDVPYEKSLGRKIGSCFLKLLEKNSVKFIPRTSVKSFIGNKLNEVKGVELSNGDVIQTDLVICAIGVKLNTQNIKMDLELNKDDNYSVPLNSFLQSVEKDNVYAAGDVASFDFFLTGEKARIEHINVALDQGRIAGLNMSSEIQKSPYHSIPFFSSGTFKKFIRLSGYLKNGYDDVVVEGDLANFSFVVYYIKEQKVIAVATCGKDPVAVASNLMLAKDQMPKYSDLILGVSNSSTILSAVQNERN